MGNEEWISVRLRVQDKAKFIADLKASGVAVKELGNQTKQAGDNMEHANRRGFWLQQTLFTIRRVVYAATLAFGSLAGAAIVLGVNFNASMEMNTIAFTRFLGSAGAAKKELSTLYDIAAKTPFEFPDLVAATRQLMAFGFEGGEANKMLLQVSDAIAGMGLSTEGIQRTVLALGQIKASGHLMGQDLLQLAQLGLVRPKVLQAKFGLTPEQYANIGASMIPSEVAIKAITEDWSTRFKGASADFQKTWTGQFSTLHDYASQMFGTMTEPLMHKMETQVFPMLSKIVSQTQRTFKQEGMSALFRAIDENVGHGLQLEKEWKLLYSAGTTIVRLLVQLGLLFRDSASIVGPLVTPVFESLVWILGIMASLLRIIRPVLKYIVALWIAERAAVGALLVVKSIHVLLTKIQATWTKAVVLWETIYLIWLLREEYITKGLNFIVEVRIALMLAMAAATGIATGAIELLTTGCYALAIALYNIPIVGWIALAITLITILYFKWKWFHNFVNDTFFWIKDHWYLLPGILAAPFLLLPFTVYAAFKQVRIFVGKIVDWIGDKMDWIARKIKGIWKAVPGSGYVSSAWGWVKGKVPGAADGGSLLTGGSLMVGERGPELVRLPAGASVSPLTPARLAPLAAGGAGGFMRLELHSHIFLDGKQIAENVETHRADVRART